MRAVTWQGKRDVRVETVPDPVIEEPTDAIVRITSTGLCGSDLHLYEVLTPVHDPGRHPRPRADGDRRGGRSGRDRTSGPATGWSSRSRSPADPVGCAAPGLPTQCETTQVHEHGMGAALFGYTKLYGAVPGAPGRVPARAAGALSVRSRCPRGRRTTGSSTSPTSCPPPGRRSSTRHVPPGGTRRACSASARSGTWPAGSRGSGAPSG